jgi:hypothetical protein
VVRCLEIDQPTAREGVYTSALMPSVVALWNGKEFVGEGAKRLMAIAGEQDLRRNRDFFFETKNEIGTSKRYGGAPKGYRSAAEIGSRILSRLMEAAGGATADKVVVTVPASFQAAQRHDTVAAARLAGIAMADGQLMDEPIAAFMDYATTTRTLKVPSGRQANLLVFDFGGGTCDVAVFKISQQPGYSGLKVASSSISRFHRLGGGDIDAAIVYDVLIPQLAKQNGLKDRDLTFTLKKQFIEPALRSIAESLKIGLSREIERRRSLGREVGDTIEKVFPGRQEIVLRERRLAFDNPLLPIRAMGDVLARFLDTYQQAPVSDEYRTARSIFGPIGDALDRAYLGRDEIDLCLLAGGSARLPQIADAMKKHFPNAICCTTRRPRTARRRSRGAPLCRPCPWRFRADRWSSPCARMQFRSRQRAIRSSSSPKEPACRIRPTGNSQSTMTWRSPPAASMAWFKCASRFSPATSTASCSASPGTFPHPFLAASRCAWSIGSMPTRSSSFGCLSARLREARPSSPGSTIR